MKKSNSSKTVIFSALFANLFIATIKFFVAFLTRSSAMLAEAIHSSADTFNQLFLLVGLRKAEKKPDELHPFGHSGELYFWSFIVAIILFSAGGVFSIYEGVLKFQHPKPLEHINYAFIVLIFSILAEGMSFYQAARKINVLRQGEPVFLYLRKTKKSELIVVFLEDLAAILGLSVALIFILLQHMTHILIFDSIASIIIGMILCGVAFFLGNEIRSLLVGEGAEPKLIKQIGEIFEDEESINKVIHIKSLQLGPDDILISVKAEFNHRLSSVQIACLINGIEKDIRERFPDVKKIFIEPDIYNQSNV